MRFTYFWPGWAIALGIAIAIGVTVFIYLRLNHPVQPTHRFLLIALRSTAVTLLLGCLLAPVVIEKKDITPPTHLSVLVDTSQSMKLVDGGTTSRLSQVNHLLFGEMNTFLQALSKRFKVHVYPFDTELHQPLTGTEPFALNPTGALTDIGTAVRQAAAEWKGQQHAGIVLITDGVQNANPLSLESVDALQTPIYPIGVGAVEPPKDIQIQRIEVSPMAYTGHEHAIRVTVVQTGYTGQTTRLSLRSENGEMDTKSITPENSERKTVNSNTLVDAVTLTLAGEPPAPDEMRTSTKQVIELKLTPEIAGCFQYTVTLPAFDGELTAENNQKTFALKVVKATLNVFYLEGTPRWEHTFLKRALMRDPDIELTTALFSKKPPADSALKRLDGYYPGSSRFPDTREELFKYDALILGDIGAEHLTAAQQGFIVDFVEAAGKAIFFLPSRTALGRDGLINTALARLLPIEIPVTGCRVWDKEFRVQLTRAGAFHPMLQLGNTPDRNVALWHGLPALSRLFRQFRLRSGATVLLEKGISRVSPYSPSSHPLRADGARQEFNVGRTPNRDAVLIFQRAGLGKSLLIAAEGLWNWDFGETDLRIYPQFWAQAIRWMATTTPTDAQRLYLTTDASTYAIGDTVSVTAQVYSETGSNLGTAQNALQAGTTVQIEVVPPEGAPFPLRVGHATTDATTADNRYTAQFEAQHKGTYRIRATSTASHSVSTGDETAIYVQPQLVELEAPQRNDSLLNQLAAQTGGSYVAIAEADQLPEKIVDVQVPVFVNEARDIWAHPLLLIGIVAMLGTEWFLRKRIGLT